MKIYTEIYELSDFTPWSEATKTWDKIIEADKDEEFIQRLDDIYPEGLSETQLNDLLWFEEEWCYELVGLNQWGVEPKDGSDVINGSDLIQYALEDAIEEYKTHNTREDGTAFGVFDFDGIDEWDFESDLDEWLAENQEEETDEDALAQSWLDQGGRQKIDEAIEKYVSEKL